MVYRLSDYSYSFIRRMRELATVEETMNLQHADIDNKLHFKPELKIAVTPFQNPCYSIDFRSEQVKCGNYNGWWIWNVSHHAEVALIPGVFHRAKTLVICNYSEFTSFGSTAFKHFIFDLDRLVFKDSIVDKEVFFKLQEFTKFNDLHIEFDRTCKFNSNLTFNHIFALCAENSNSLTISGIWKDQWLHHLCSAYANVPSVLILNNVSPTRLIKEDLSNLFYQILQVKSSFELRLCGAVKPFFEVTKYFKSNRDSNNPYRLILDNRFCYDFNLQHYKQFYDYAYGRKPAQKFSVKDLIEKYSAVGVAA